VDLNRNFPDPAAGNHPDGNPWQPETIIMMNLAESNNFVLSANFHGGTEVVNYPWDTWSRFHPDDNWFKFVSHQYADTVQAHSPSNYMNGYDDGITNGYAWYRITGGRQDYFTFFRQGREVTIEISDTKILPGSLLPAHWEYNKRSFLSYIEQCMFGINGIVTGAGNEPLKAQIKIIGHDFDNSEIYSDSISGSYSRMIYPGNYSLIISAPGHLTDTINNISVSSFNSTRLNIQLEPENPIPVELISFTASVENSNVILKWVTGSEINNHGYDIERGHNSPGKLYWEKIGFVTGNGTSSDKHSYSFTDQKLSAGKYEYKLKQINYDGSFTISDLVEVEIVSPGEFILYQNYPNPFNPSSKIKYTVPFQAGNHPVYVQLTVFDLLGNKMALLVNEEQKPGEYVLEFNGSNYASGLYFYRLTAGNFTDTKSMILIK
jgi:hypothetical protein